MEDWIKCSDRLPEYYELIWVSDGETVVLSIMVGRSYTPMKRIFRNKERDGFYELGGVKYWMPCYKPEPLNKKEAKT